MAVRVLCFADIEAEVAPVPMSKYDVIPLILAAGKGVRMKSDLPKVALEVCGQPMIKRIVNVSAAISDEKPCVVVGSGADYVREALEDVPVHWIYQKEQLGTGHAVAQARSDLAESGKNVIILCGDTPLLRSETLARLCAHHIESGAVATLVTTELDNPKGYGRIIRSQHSGAFVSIVEERDCQEHDKRICEINAGLYVVSAKVLFETLDRVGSENDQGEYYLTDVFGLLAEDGHTVEALNLPIEEELLGVNDRLQLAEATKILRLRACEDLMRNGVSVAAPSLTFVDDDVVVGSDTHIEPNVHILAGTKVGRHCRIGTGCHLTNCTIGDNVTILPYTVAQGAVIKDEVTSGPFSRLREGAVLEKGSKTGNFVELKKTTLGPGSKASHLAYLGDSTIGAGANIGAGTITCNYDGVNKHPTIIGDEVFVGSNSTLVAPLELADRSYIAAGSTVNRNVPSEALAIGRARQVNKEDYRKLLDRRMGTKK